MSHSYTYEIPCLLVIIRKTIIILPYEVQVKTLLKSKKIYSTELYKSTINNIDFLMIHHRLNWILRISNSNLQLIAHQMHCMCMQ